MKTAKQFGRVPITDNNTYVYQNDSATYNITFVPESEIRTKYEILCHVDQLVEAVSKEIDLFQSPEDFDLLDLTLCTYVVGELGGKIFYLSSYTVKIELVDLSSGVDLHVDDSIQLPFFDMNENKRFIKGFKNFR